MFVSRFCILVSVSLVTTTANRADTAPEFTQSFVQQYCVSCHDAENRKGDFQIDNLPWSLTETDTRDQWELVYDYVSFGDMPPEKAKRHPDAAARETLLTELERAFAQADESAKPGGTPARRLNRVEYLNTVRDIFGFRMIDLPLSFPEDAPTTEFDTMPEGLFLSPAVMEGYHDVATEIADRFAPLPNPPTYSSSLTTGTIGGDAGRRWFGPDNESLKFSGFNHSGWVGGLWDPLFVAPASGVYRVRLLANAQAESGADGRPLSLSFYTFDPTEEQLMKRYRLERATFVAEVAVPAGEPRWIECDVPVEKGETFHIYCANRLLPGQYPMGDLNRAEISTFLKKVKTWSEPTVELRGMKVQGPIDVPPRVKEFFGSWPPKSNRTELEKKLLPLASQAFRRPLTDTESEKLTASVLEHGARSEKPEFAWHYAIRRILCSPEFLYREAENASLLSEYALASRLSYFLWSSMPDSELLELAAAGKLSDPDTLVAQTERLLNDSKSAQFVKHFTGQWLGNRDVEAINVCDNRYEWDDNVRYGFVRSTEMFFEEVLRENLPISTFIDSDFTYANSAMRVIWEMESKVDKTLAAVAARQRQSLVWPEPDRVSLSTTSENLPAHVRNRGGVLGLPGVLTVTGDGVESSPILRGVWVLDNLFGKHPPPPPKDVPAIDIDTSQSTSVRETLKAHTELESCAKCHRDIDPIGLALENYNAIGGWRTEYAGAKGSAIDASSTLPDGSQLDGAASIKKHLLDNRETFTRCLLTKLLEYGAGRKLSVGDRRVVDEIVAREPSEGYRFQDLVIAAINSEVFRAK